MDSTPPELLHSAPAGAGGPVGQRQQHGQVADPEDAGHCPAPQRPGFPTQVAPKPRPPSQPDCKLTKNMVIHHTNDKTNIYNKALRRSVRSLARKTNNQRTALFQSQGPSPNPPPPTGPEPTAPQREPGESARLGQCFSSARAPSCNTWASSGCAAMA